MVKDLGSGGFPMGFNFLGLILWVWQLLGGGQRLFLC
ncbi:hypothetical protein RDI58_022182 [Solanum bulbocastanum]|uniref:Uncharacterized protein n=1 Tax=Solanum bulbocastanum TaxID=147425 RepID=A0AAN8Y7U9_SOLBU